MLRQRWSSVPLPIFRLIHMEKCYPIAYNSIIISCTPPQMGRRRKNNKTQLSRDKCITTFGYCTLQCRLMAVSHPMRSIVYACGSPSPMRTRRNEMHRRTKPKIRCSCEHWQQAKIARSKNYNCSIWRGCRLRRIAGCRAHCFKAVRPNVGNHTIALITSFEGNGRILCVCGFGFEPPT